jgi:trk system potassium uptake protein TrkA
VILGCGRVGARLATILSKSHHVTVIDWNPSAFERLGTSFRGDTLLGNGIDVDVLRAGEVEQADIFLALTDGDNRNLMAAQIADYLGVPRVLARVYDAERSIIFEQIGLRTVSPTINGAARLYNMVVREREEV